MLETIIENKGLRLPQVRTPSFEYLPVIVYKNIAYVSGQLPWDDSFKSVIKGKVGGDLSLEEGREAARRCVLSGMAFLKESLGSFSSVERVIKVSGFVASAPGFTEQPAVIDAASSLLVSLFGDSGRHARSAIGVYELPRGSAVEIEFLFGLHDE